MMRVSAGLRRILERHGGTSRVLAVMGLLSAAAACDRLVLTPHPATEQRTEIQGDHFKVIATIAASDLRSVISIMVHVRTKLNEAGITAVPSAGRWDTEQEACNTVCARTDQSIDGVLVVDVAELRLIDCATGTTAYAVLGDMSGGVGIDALIARLIAYLRPTPPKPIV